MSNEIGVPEILREQRDYCLQIERCNGKMFQHIDYLRKLVTRMHQIYQRLCRRMTQLADEYERELMKEQYQCTHGGVLLSFVRKLNSIHLTLNHQINSNSVALGTKTHKIAKNRLELLRERLGKCDRLNEEYLERAEKYNSKQEEYEEKCEYFRDYEKDTLKYYSMRANTELYEKLKGKEEKLRQKQEELYRLRDEYAASVADIRISVKEYFEMEKNIVAEYKKLLLNIRRGALQEHRQVYNEPIIEVNEEASETVNQELGPSTRRTVKESTERVVTIQQMRKEIVREFRSSLEVEELMEAVFREVLEGISAAGEAIDEVRGEGDYKAFIGEKMMMQEILSGDSIRDIDLLINEVSFFRVIVLKVETLFSKVKVLTELKKYRGFNYDRFLEDTSPLLEQQKQEGHSQKLKMSYLALEYKFHDSNSEYTVRFRDKVTELESQITSHYFSEEASVEEGRGRRVHNDLFQKKYYEILMHPFFLKDEHFNFIQNRHLGKFGRLINANRIQKMMTLTSSFSARKAGRGGCCGGWFCGPEEGPEVLDEFHCALKDGYILIQGKLKLYKHYILFTSSFNSKTLFGYSDIRIPRWEVVHFGREKHLLSLMLVVETTHGNLEFTSFLSNPLDKLAEIYDQRKSGVSVLHQGSRGEQELVLVEEAFQRHFQAELKRVGVIIDKLSTYLSEDALRLSICIEYHPEGLSNTLLFEIKVHQNEMSLEYIFVHDEKANSSELKSRLERVSKELINEDPRGRPFLQESANKQIDISCSMIELNEVNRLSLIKEPSFIDDGQGEHSKKEEDIGIGIGTTLELANLLSSRNIHTGMLDSAKSQTWVPHLPGDPNEPSENMEPQETSFNLTRLHKGQSCPPNSSDSQKVEVVVVTSRQSVGEKHSQISNRVGSSRRSSLSNASTKGGVSYSFLGYFLGVVLLLNLFFSWLG